MVNRPLPLLLPWTVAVAILATVPGSPAEEPVRVAAPKKSLEDELPRIPPVEPDKALATFTVQHGFRLH